ncbi:MAG TPA: aminotransferase class I/II-fold pyridoxal phosphate-dependent enzyme [Candidatus Methanofastidiosa archaeon]|nr:aminotransferase class I/II-fold pyridoxal phosphate-dependent enzyme [Candidatus Methanofastidiosa archaeon]
MIGSHRLSRIGSYAFADVDKLVDSLKEKGIEPIDFGVGDPQEPTPQLVIDACKESLERTRSSGYPSYDGSLEYRNKVSEWVKGRFGVDVDPSTEVTSTVGAKEAVFHMPLAFVNRGDYVIIPNPYYPAYERGTIFASGSCHFLNLTKEENFQLDLGSIPDEVVRKARILWVNYPSNPTGALAEDSFMKELADFAVDNDVLVVSDECYSEMYFDKRPRSLLEFGHENILSIHSLSKRSNMTNYRVGWVMGDGNAISLFRKVKTNIDSGTPTFIQEAAISALSDETHVEKMRKGYQEKRDIICNAFKDIGYPESIPEATFYIWQQVPEGMSGVEVAKTLLEESTALVTTPGAWISKEVNGVNPGDRFIRLALVPSVESCKIAAEKIMGAEGLYP